MNVNQGTIQYNRDSPFPTNPLLSPLHLPPQSAECESQDFDARVMIVSMALLDLQNFYLHRRADLANE